MPPIRRIAANSVVLPDSSVLNLAVLELEEGIVTKVSPLERELPFTEWIGGSVTLHAGDDGKLYAYKDGKIIK